MSKRITGLPPAAAAALSQLIEIVNDPSGTPVSQKLSLTQLVVLTGAATNGGTGQTTVTTGDLLYGSAANVWSRLADVATGNALISGGIGVIPGWGKIGLGTHVSGTLPISSGGTGQTTLAAAGIVVGPGSATDNAITRFDGTTGKVIQNSTTTVTDAGFLSIGTTTDPGGSAILIAAPNGEPPAVGATDSNGAIKIHSANTLAYATGASNTPPYPIWYQTYGTNGAGPYPIVFNPSGGGVGIGLLNCTAILHIAGGSDTGGASLKMETGTFLTSPEPGAIEFDGTNLTFTESTPIRKYILANSDITTETVIPDTTLTVVIGGASFKLVALAI